MNATFQVHMDLGTSEIIWWADTEAIPGFSAAADSLKDLRVLIDEAAVTHLGAGTTVALELVADVPVPESENEPPERSEDPRPGLFDGSEVRQTIVMVPPSS
jgi:predicted RNase H-like HicB family nuclease